MRDSPVFITGMPRSGTSLAYRTLQTQSSFRIGSEDWKVDLTETHIFSSVLVASSIILEANPRLKAYMLDDEALWTELRETIRPLGRFQGWISRLRRHDENTSWRQTMDGHVARIYFRIAREARGVKRIVEKTPGHAWRLQRIADCFPESKVLFVTRHPVDVYTSFRKRLRRDLTAGVDRAKLSWLELDPPEFCKMYTNVTETAMRHRDTHPEQLLFVKHEHMTSDPNLTLQSICQFLDESFEASGVMMVPSSVSRYRPAGTPKESLLQRDIRVESSSWRAHIAEKEALLIESSLSRELELLNYGRYTQT